MTYNLFNKEIQMFAVDVSVVFFIIRIFTLLIKKTKGIVFSLQQKLQVRILNEIHCIDNTNVYDQSKVSQTNTFKENIARIAKRCPSNIASIVNVSSCLYLKMSLLLPSLLSLLLLSLLLPSLLLLSLLLLSLPRNSISLVFGVTDVLRYVTIVTSVQCTDVLERCYNGYICMGFPSTSVSKLQPSRDIATYSLNRPQGRTAHFTLLSTDSLIFQQIPRPYSCRH